MNALYSLFFPLSQEKKIEPENVMDVIDVKDLEPTVRQEAYSIQEEWFAKDFTVQASVTTSMPVEPSIPSILQEPIPFDESKLLELSDIDRILDEHERLLTDQELEEMASIRDRDIHEDIMRILMDIL